MIGRDYGEAECPVCGKRFAKHASNQRLCSERCRRMGKGNVYVAMSRQFVLDQEARRIDEANARRRRLAARDAAYEAAFPGESRNRNRGVIASGCVGHRDSQFTMEICRRFA